MTDSVQGRNSAEDRYRAALGFMLAHERSDRLSKVVNKEPDDERTFRVRTRKLQRRIHRAGTAMATAGGLALGSVTAVFIDPALLGAAGTVGAFIGVASLTSATYEFGKSKLTKKWVESDFKNREPDLNEDRLKERTQLRLDVAEWEKEFFALNLDSTLDFRESETLLVAKTVIKRTEAHGKASVRSIVDWELPNTKKELRSVFVDDYKVLDQLWEFVPGGVVTDALSQRLSENEKQFLVSDKRSKDVLERWRYSFSKQVDKIDALKASKHYKQDGYKKIWLIDGIRAQSQVINGLLNEVNCLSLPTTHTLAKYADLEAFRSHHLVLSRLEPKTFRVVGGIPMLSETQNRIMRSEFTARQVLAAWQYENHDYLVALRRFVQTSVEEPDITNQQLLIANDWEMTVVESLQQRIDSLARESPEFGL